MRVALLPVSLAVASIVWLAPGVARPCDCAEVRPSILLPRDGATDVPINTRVLVTPDRLGLDAWVGTDMSRIPSIAVMPVTAKGVRGAALKARVSVMLSEGGGTVIVLTPDKPLKASSDYELVHRVGKTKKDWVSVSRFMTGKTADTAAPSFDGAQGFTAVVSFRSAVTKCDGKPPYSELTWKYGDAKDDRATTGDLLRITYVQKKGEQRTIRLIEPTDAPQPVREIAGSLCDPFKVAMQAGDEVCVTVEVIDLAGNAAGSLVEKCMVAKKM
jgi:hypothetical protein